MKNIYQIFGSASSIDYDVMVFVDKIPSIEESKHLCDKFNKELYQIFVDNNFTIKKVGCNIARLKDGIIVQVHKGTSDECNNSLYTTYHLHRQMFPNQIIRLVPRDVDLKILRTARVLLMFLSRTEKRIEVKSALQSNFLEKIKTLETINLSDIKDISKNIEWNSYLKTMSFQLSQTISLMNGIELYTKEELSLEYPELAGMIERNNENLNILDKYKNIFINLCKKRIPFMKTYDEYKI